MKTKENGYLTVYMALVLAILLSLFLALFEGVRSNTIRMEAECIMNIGMNSIFGEYHRKLFEKYNILAIDSSYGSSNGGMINTQQHLNDYLKKNMLQTSEKNKLLQSFVYKDFLDIQPEETKVTKTLILSDYGGEVYRREAVKAIEDDVGIAGINTFLEWVQTVEDNDLQGRNLSREKQELNKEIQTARGKKTGWEEDKWGQLLLGNATDELDKQWAEDILGLLIEDTSGLSQLALEDDDLIYFRMRRGAANEGNWQLQELPEEKQITEKFFFQKYLMKYFGYFGNENLDGALQYQIEYLIGGKKTDVENLKEVVVQISSIRDAANIAFLLSDEEKYSQAELLGSFVAALIMMPELKDLLTMSLIVSWGFAESLYDMRQIMNGGRIPLLKTENTWHYSLDDILWAAFDAPEEKEKEGLSYEDYLHILLAMVSEEDACGRAMNITEANVRTTPGNCFFRMDNCFVSIEASTRVISGYGYQYEITRERAY